MPTPIIDADFLDLEKIDPAELVRRVIKAGDAWADADAAASSMEDSKKSILAELILKFTMMPKPDGKGLLSQIAAETNALADPAFTAHVELQVEMRRSANRMRVRYDLGKVYIDLLRSQEATRRAEASIR
jgi:hypothetical protein